MATCFSEPALATAINREYYLKIARDKSQPVSRRIACYDRVAKEGAYADFTLWYEKGSLQREIYDYDGAVKSMYHAIDLAPADSIEQRCMMLLEAADTHQQNHRYREAAADILKALKIDKPDSLRYLQPLAYVIIASLFERLENLPKQKHYLDRAEAEIKEITATTSPARLRKLSLNYNVCRGNLYYFGKHWDNAITYWKKAMTFTTDSAELGQLNASMGLLFHHMGDYEKAIEYNLEFLRKNYGGYNDCRAALNYVHTLMLAGQLTEARQALDNYYHLLARLKGADREALEFMSGEIEHSLGNEVTAFSHIKRAYEIKDSLSVMERSIYTSSLDEDIVAWEKEKIESQRERRHHVTRWALTLGGGLIAGLIIVLVITSQIHRRKRHAAAQEQHVSLLKETWQQERDQAERNLHVRDKELSDMSIHMAQLSDALNEISALTARRSGTPSENLTAIRQIVKRLSVQDNAWEMFKVYFEKYNHNFFKRLYELHPDLTNAEKRMCAFLLMGMTTKEIASLTNRSPNTVHCIKNNLRHKLHITEPTESYLHRISITSSSD